MTADRPDLDDVLDTGLSTYFRNRPRDASGSLGVGSAEPRRADPVLPAKLGRLSVGEVLGRGGMAVVLRAHDPELGRDVAVKVLQEPFDDDEELIERFLNEARVSSQLQHPGIVPVYDVGRTDDGRPYYTMKIVDGDTLKELIDARAHSRSERSRLLETFARVCDTVAFAHARGVVHGDLKPSNIMVGAFGEVQVLDWGFAKALRAPGSGDDANASAGRAVGTPAYMTPEQARGDVSGIDRRTDVFGLGGILCEILTGAPVYLGETRSEIVLRATKGWIDDTVQRLRACEADRALIELAVTCLAPDPEQRPADASFVAARIVDHLTSLEERSRALQIAAAEERARAGQERRARRLTLAMAVAIVVALASAGGGYLWVQNEQRERAAEQEHVAVAAIERARVLFDAAQRSPLGDLAVWREAAAAARQADEVAAPGDGEVARRARSLRAEVESRHAVAERDEGMRRLLEQIRLRYEEDSSPEDLDRAYAEAFRDYGVDLDSVGVEAAAEALRSSRIREELIAGLDDWGRWRGRVSGMTVEPWRRVLAVATELDEHPMRRDLRRAISLGDHEHVRSTAQSADLREAPASAWDMLGTALIDRRDFELAVSVYRKARSALPHDFWVHHELAALLNNIENRPTDEVIALSWTCVSLRPDSAHAWTDLGVRLVWTVEGAAEGQAALRRALEIDPSYARAWALLGGLLSAQNRVEEGVEALQQAVVHGADNPNALQSAALGLEFDALRPADALPVYAELAQLRPDDAETHRMRGSCALRLGHFDRAIESLRRAAELEPDNTELRRWLGRALIASGRFAEAVTELQNVGQVAREAATSPAESKLAACLADAESLRAALAGASEQPAEPAQRLASARAALYRGRTGEALELFASAFEQDDSVADRRADLQPAVFEAACAAAAEGQGERARAWLGDAARAWRRSRRAGEYRDEEFLSVLVEPFARPELEPFRDEDALANLPEPERRAWHALWSELRMLRGELRGR